MNIRPPALPAPKTLGRVTITSSPIITAAAAKAPTTLYAAAAKPLIAAVVQPSAAVVAKPLPASLILAPTAKPSASIAAASQVFNPSPAASAYANTGAVAAVIKKPSATVAPDFINAKSTLPALAPEIAKPGITQPAANPYAPDASWEDFAETPQAAAAEEDPFADVPDAFVQPRSADDTTPIIKTSAAKVVEPSWFDKLLSVFGLSRRSAVSATMAGEAASMATMTQSEAAAQLVRRARNGDQNAMAMIVCVRDAAARGSAKAKLSAKLMLAYMKSHPVGDDPAEFGIEDVIPRSTPEPSDPATAAAVALSHGPLLSNPRIEEFVQHARFHADELNAFEHGLAGRAMRNPDPRIQKANKFGGLMAHARKLQAVRMPNSPVKKFDTNIGWELGEDID